VSCLSLTEDELTDTSLVPDCWIRLESEAVLMARGMISSSLARMGRIIMGELKLLYWHKTISDKSPEWTRSTLRNYKSMTVSLSGISTVGKD
jgi:hypothetical protein